MIQIKTSKCLLLLTEAELISLLATNEELWLKAVQRGKAFKRQEQATQRQNKTDINSKMEGRDN